MSELGHTPSLRPGPMDLAGGLDRLALQTLAWTCCHAIDRRDYSLVRSLYHDDAVDDHGAMFKGGPDAYVAWLPGMMENWEATSHVISNMVYLIDGDDAEGELVVEAYHRTASSPRREIIAGGRYLDRYQKRDGVWRFWRRSLVLDWSQTRPAAAETGPLDDGVSKGRTDAGDPCFERLPLFAAQYRRT